jgi:16S rRNA (guanine(966)-N(2))-methyltransferase RsmD
MTSLRVIGGTAKGQRLKSVPGDTTRPVTDRVKEALFNILGADIQEAVFFDLFAGTGAIGIEALSRGAAFALFTDLNRLPVETIRANLKSTRLEDRAEVMRADALSFLERPPLRTFDYVYIAPPQYKGLWKEALRRLDAHLGWLSPDAWVIVQIHPIEYESVLEEPGLVNLVEFEQRRYGSTLLVFLTLKADE